MGAVAHSYIIAQYFLAAIFLLGLFHKLSAPSRFLGAVENYQVFPNWVVIPACVFVCLAELVTVAFLIAYPLAGAAGALFLLLAYSMMLSINLLRGRRYIDCGCSLVDSGKQQEYLSWYMVIRNFCLALPALSLVRPLQVNFAHWTDYVVIAMGGVLSLALYIVLDRVLTQYFFIRHHAQQSFWHNKEKIA